MTRKHFEALARALKFTNANTQICDAVARVCEKSNDKFDYYKFLKACGHD